MILPTSTKTLNLSTLKSARINCIPVDISLIIYRPPNKDIASSNDKMCITLEIMKTEKKIMLFLEKHHINLLNHDSHLDIDAFSDIRSSYSCVTLITRPTSVIAKTATLSDIILTNIVENITTLIKASLLQMWLIITHFLTFIWFPW